MAWEGYEWWMAVTERHKHFRLIAKKEKRNDSVVCELLRYTTNPDGGKYTPLDYLKKKKKSLY